MPRIVYTSVRSARPVTDWIDAPDLATAERALSLANTGLRFWSHPFFGDAPGHSPEDALRRAAKPSSLGTHITIALAVAALPGPLLVYCGMAAEVAGHRIPAPSWAFVPVLGSILLQIPCFAFLRRELEVRRYGHALALLWLMRVSFPPFGFTVLTLWAVKIHAGRRGMDAALAPYGWLRHVGLDRAYEHLRLQALDQLAVTGERIARQREMAARGPNASNEVDLALSLLLYEGDVVAARAVLLRSEGRSFTPIVAVARQLAVALIAIEEGKGSGVDVERARVAFIVATQGSGGAWTPLFDATSARAFAQEGRFDVARAFLSRAAPPLLWSGEHRVLDRAAADLARAEAGVLATRRDGRT